MQCNDCPRFCKIDRKKRKGFCGAKDQIVLAKVIENFMWEEPCISGKKGTLALFFAGCNLKCSYCQNYKISHEIKGDEFSVEEFASFLTTFNMKKYSALELITPTHFSSLLIKVFQIFKSPIPVVWNSSGYENEKTISQISKFVDVFLPDFKYSDNDLATKLSCAPNYFEIATNAIKKMRKEKGKNVFKNGLLINGILIRHLVLPGQIENSKNVLNKIKEKINEPFISLMSQFVPIKQDKHFSRTILPLEYKIILNYAKKLKLENGYLQEYTSANDSFIPNF